GDFEQYELATLDPLPDSTLSGSGSSNTVLLQGFDPATGLSRFRARNGQNVSDLKDPITRVRVTYRNLSEITIKFGGVSTAYFFLDFSSGPNFASAVPVVSPGLDLNTLNIGVNNEGEICGKTIRFTADSTAAANVTAPPSGNYDSLLVTIPGSHVKDGASERILINGASGTSAVALNASVGGIGTFTLSSVNYTVSRYDA